MFPGSVVDVVIAVDKGLDVGIVGASGVEQDPVVKEGVGCGTNLACDAVLVLCIGAVLSAADCCGVTAGAR
jgi:hypothetical protein